MIIDTDFLIKVSTVAKKIDKSAIWVHKLAEQEKLTKVLIDEVAFIVADEKYNNVIKEYDNQ